jgi:membrane protein
MVDMVTLPGWRAARLRATTPSAQPSEPRPVKGVLRRTGSGLRAVWAVIRSMLVKAWQDRILGLSAEAAFWQLTSVPPLMLAILAVLGYAGRWTGTDLVDRVESHALRLTARLVSGTVQQEVVTPIVTELLRHGRGGVATISVVAGLWAGSSATATFVNTVTIAYGQRDLRGAVASRLLALWLYVCTLATAVVAAPLLILGPNFVVSRLPESWHEVAETGVQLAYWPLTAAIVFGALSAFYHYAPPLRLTWQRAMPGAVLALLLFLALSWGLRFYIGRVNGQMLIFSTLAAPVVALLYFYVLAFAVLLGAELNGTLELLYPAGRRPLHRHRVARIGRRLAQAVRGTPPEPSTPEMTAGPASTPSDGADAEPNMRVAHSPLGRES